MVLRPFARARARILIAPLPPPCADPGDGRAKLVCLTRRGRAALRVLRATALTVEQEWATVLGLERLASFRDTLTVLLTDGAASRRERLAEVRAQPAGDGPVGLPGRFPFQRVAHAGDGDLPGLLAERGEQRVLVRAEFRVFVLAHH